jgi:hypothetical protein
VSGVALRRAALRYAEMSWPCFPVTPGGKAPLGRLAPHGLKDATTDPDRIAQWWDKEPNANIGIATGITVDVLDVDGYEGWQSLTRVVAEHGCLSSSPVASTPRDGAHYYFLPTGSGNKAGFLPGLDWRGSGGYVVAPPSVRSEGNRYEWQVMPKEQPLEKAPSWLVGLLNPKPVRSAYQSAVPASSTTRYGRGALAREIGSLIMAPEGQRNHQLNQAAFSLGQLVAGGEIDLEVVTHDLLNAGIRAGLDEKECVATIHSGIHAGIEQPRGVLS